MVNAAHQLFESLARFSADNHVFKTSEVASIEHPRLGKGQLVDRVVGDVVPIDEFAEHVLVDAEWEHGRNGLESHPLLIRKPLELGDSIEVSSAECTVPGLIDG